MDSKLFNITEASTTLRVKESTIRAWIYQKRLPVVRLGSRVFIKAETIDTILEGGLLALHCQ